MKNTIQAFVLIMGMMIISLISYSQDPDFHIYLCFGQSNMEGMGTVETQDRATNARVKVFQDQTCSNLNRAYGTWYTAAPPLNRCWSGLGPADYFGKTMADATASNITIGLIPAAVGGCDIAFFQKGAPLGKASVKGGSNADIPSQFTGGYEWIIDMVTKAKKVGVIKGIIFHQGETNTGDPNWKYNVQGIVNNLRTDLSLGNIPFLAGEVLYAQYGSCCSSHNIEVNKIPGVISNSYVISASGLPGQDVAHFTSASYRTLGWRYAQQMIALESNTCISTPLQSFMQTDGINWIEQSTVQVCAGSTIKLGPHPIDNSGWRWTGPGNFNAATREITLSNLAVAQGGVYTATYKNASGCSSTAQITVTVKALPLAPTVPTPVPYCHNALAMPLTATGSGLKWYAGVTGSNGSATAPTPVTTAVGTANYYVSQTSNGCESTRSKITVVVNPLPTAAITTTSPTTFCAGGSVLLTSSSGTSYKWMNGNTPVGTAAAYPANSTGNYTVEVTHENGCKATSAAKSVTVTAPATWYADTDNDGKGDVAVTQTACIKPAGYVSSAGDLCPADAAKITAGDCGCGNTETSCMDCAGIVNGTASIDVCNRCSGGTTGIVAVADAANCITTGVVDLAANASIKILPNPSSEEFALLLTNASTVQVLTIDGKLVEVFNGVTNLNFGATYAKGVYVVHINTGNTSQILRVIKL